MNCWLCFYFALTFTVAFMPSVVTVMVAVPARTPFTVPFASTTATSGLEEVHISVVTALAGISFAFSRGPAPSGPSWPWRAWRGSLS